MFLGREGGEVLALFDTIMRLEAYSIDMLLNSSLTTDRKTNYVIMRVRQTGGAVYTWRQEFF
jgi:hypothetical protein